jgi:polysaccharide export outer membrane protein
MIAPKYFLLIASICFFSCFQMSCISTQKVVYLNDLADSSKGSLNKARINFENPIQKNDQLWITVGGSNPEDLVALNSGNGTGAGSNGSTINVGGASIGYLVEADGSIKIPYIGKLKVVGLSRSQLADTLSILYKDYTKNPIVNVRFLNYQYAVLGEVRNGGRFNMPNERVTILEAIGMAGDLTEMAKRDNVLLVREMNGERSFARVNLLSKDLFNSPYFYLKSNDVVYVEPVRAKFINRTGVPQYLGIVAVGLSLLITIINVVK